MMRWMIHCFIRLTGSRITLIGRFIVLKCQKKDGVLQPYNNDNKLLVLGVSQQQIHAMNLKTFLKHGLSAVFCENVG